MRLNLVDEAEFCRIIKNIIVVAILKGMGMCESEDVEPADTVEEKITSESIPSKRRQTYYIRIDLMEKLKSYAYWERMGISETVNMALEEFLKDWSFREPTE